MKKVIAVLAIAVALIAGVTTVPTSTNDQEAVKMQPHKADPGGGI
jgi:hypothetical protein